MVNLQYRNPNLPALLWRLMTPKMETGRRRLGRSKLTWRGWGSDFDAPAVSQSRVSYAPMAFQVCSSDRICPSSRVWNASAYQLKRHCMVSDRVEELLRQSISIKSKKNYRPQKSISYVIYELLRLASLSIEDCVNPVRTWEAQAHSCYAEIVEQSGDDLQKSSS